MIKLLRTIRFDASDDRVFANAAPADDWAVSGAFAFAGLEAAAIVGKTRQAFANGFLGIPSFGHSTFATVGEAMPEQHADLVYRLAVYLVAAYGAPDIDAGLQAAAEEVAFIEELCRDALLNTVFTVHRRRDRDDHIREQFRTIKPPADEPLHARIWTVEQE
jgi:Family of unknown function (DUF6505)